MCFEVMFVLYFSNMTLPSEAPFTITQTQIDCNHLAFTTGNKSYFYNSFTKTCLIYPTKIYSVESLVEQAGYKYFVEAPCNFVRETQPGFSENYNRIHLGGEEEASCESICSSNVDCTYWFVSGACQVFGSPILFVDTSTNMTTEKCREMCALNTKCATAITRPGECQLYDSKQTDFVDEAERTVFHKVDLNC